MVTKGKTAVEAGRKAEAKAKDEETKVEEAPGVTSLAAIIHAGVAPIIRVGHQSIPVALLAVG